MICSCYKNSCEWKKKQQKITLSSSVMLIRTDPYKLPKYFEIIEVGIALSLSYNVRQSAANYCYLWNSIYTARLIQKTSTTWNVTTNINQMILSLVWSFFFRYLDFMAGCMDMRIRRMLWKKKRSYNNNKKAHFISNIFA